jgi:hypothetical protein
MTEVVFTNGMYKWVDQDGKVNISDQPPPPGTLSEDKAFRDNNCKGEVCTMPVPYEDTKKIIKEVQKRVPKLLDYLDALDYLRNRAPLQFAKALEELKKVNPEAWMKLQAYPQMQPLKASFLVDKSLESAVSLFASQLPTPSAGKGGAAVFDSVIKETQILMKRDGYPYADGALNKPMGEFYVDSKGKAVIPPEREYSNSRLGQYMKEEDPRLAKAGAASQKALQEANRGVVKSAGAAVGRVGGPFLDLGLAALDPEAGRSFANKTLRDRMMQLWGQGVISVEEANDIQNLIGTDPARANRMLQEAQKKYIKGE